MHSYICPTTVLLLIHDYIDVITANNTAHSTHVATPPTPNKQCPSSSLVHTRMRMAG